MGWASGTEPFCVIAKAVKKNVEDKRKRTAVYKAMLKAFMDQDWDCLDEAEGIDPILDKLISETR